MTENKGDLISREALKEEVRKRVIGNNLDVFVAKNIMCLIDNAPTVEQTIITEFKGCDNCELERPTGEWIFIDILEDDNFPMDKGSKIYECSVCGRRIWTFCEDLTDFYPFCHCGADMRKGAEE